MPCRPQPTDGADSVDPPPFSHAPSNTKFSTVRELSSTRDQHSPQSPSPSKRSIFIFILQPHRKRGTQAGSCRQGRVHAVLFSGMNKARELSARLCVYLPPALEVFGMYACRIASSTSNRWCFIHLWVSGALITCRFRRLENSSSSNSSNRRSHKTCSPPPKRHRELHD